MSATGKVFLTDVNGAVGSDINCAEFDLSIGGDVQRFSIGWNCEHAGLADIVDIGRELADLTIAKTIEGIEERGVKVSCCKGCHAGCCKYSMVSLSVPEALKFAQEVSLLEADQRAMVEGNCRRSAGIIQEYIQGRMEQTSNFCPDRNSILDWYMDAGLACNFLYDNCCQIYPLRPITCRECLVVSPASSCDRNSDGFVKKVHLPVRIANVLTSLSSQLLGTADELIVLPCVFGWMDNSGWLFDKQWRVDFLIEKFIEVLAENNRKMTLSVRS